MARVTVVGGGVIGLTTAHELAADGHRVQLVTAADALDSTSAAAAALWFPHDVTVSAEIVRSARVTYDRLDQLSRQPGTGVHLRRGTVVHRHSDPDLTWTAAVPEHGPADPGDLPPGSTGVSCVVPVAVTHVYLRWLQVACQRSGVTVSRQHVEAVSEIDPSADVVVVAAGVRSAALLGDDDTAFPIRGQVVRLANPGLTDWITDDDHPDGETYVIPREDDVVCGGTEDRDAWDMAVDPIVEAAILRRCREIVPALTGQPVVSRAVGLRPGRPSVRLEIVAGSDRPVIACYGHGGAGFTLSWGEAARVRALLATV